MASTIVAKIKELLADGKESEAMTRATRHLDEFRDKNDTAGIAAMLLAVSEVALAQGKPDQALKAAREAWPVVRRIGDKKLQAAVLMAMIYGLKRQGKSKEVVKACSSSMQAILDTKDSALEGSLLHIMASAHLDIDEPEEAMAAEEKASKIYKELKDKQGEAGSLTNVARAQRMLGNFEEAISSAEKAATMWRDAGKAAGIAVCVETIGDAQAAQGFPRNALATAREQLELLQKKGCDSMNELLMMEKVAQVEYDLGEVADSLKTMEDMCTVCAKAKDWLAEAQATKRAAQAQAEAFHTKDAMRLAKRARQLFEDLNLKEDLEEIKTLQSNILVKRLEYSKAPNRKKALETLKSFLNAVEERNVPQVKQLEVELEKYTGALKEDEMTNALAGLFRRDDGALKFLEGHGWDLNVFKVETKIYMTPHKFYYLHMAYTGMNFGPAYRVVNPYRIGFLEDNSIRACSVCQQFDTESWEHCLLFPTGIMDAGIQVQGIFYNEPRTRAQAAKNNWR